MAKSKTPKARKQSWRDYADHLHRAFRQQPNPESLHPGPSTVERAVAGSREARSIIEFYAFRFPVTTVEDLDAL